MSDLGRRLEACYSAIVHDIMRAQGHTNFLLPSNIRLVQPERRLAGPVWTVEGHVDEGADAHETLLEWTGVLAKARPGHVAVCQPHTHDIALMGELSSETLKFRGVSGYVVDGPARDVAQTMQQQFPLACTHFTPKDIVGRWLPHAFDEPVQIGDVRIHAGDYLLADMDGICILPRAQAETIVKAAEEAIGTENKVRTAILEGMDPQEAYRKYGKF
ncbi:MAG: RraA family protein [Geminicoccaceae bacterium]|nr:RraA family protein [Geminicoccaceae bacterium]